MIFKINIYNDKLTIYDEYKNSSVVTYIYVSIFSTTRVKRLAKPNDILSGIYAGQSSNWTHTINNRWNYIDTNHAIILLILIIIMIIIIFTYYFQFSPYKNKIKNIHLDNISWFKTISIFNWKKKNFPPLEQTPVSSWNCSLILIYFYKIAFK